LNNKITKGINKRETEKSVSLFYKELPIHPRPPQADGDELAK
jgi:hypothetical protein